MNAWKLALIAAGDAKGADIEFYPITGDNLKFDVSRDGRKKTCALSGCYVAMHPDSTWSEATRIVASKLMEIERDLEFDAERLEREAH